MSQSNNWNKIEVNDPKSYPPEGTVCILYVEELKEFGRFLGSYQFNGDTKRHEYWTFDGESITDVTHWMLSPDIPL